MTERGILFTPENYGKSEDGSKTQTRRLNGLAYPNTSPDEFELVAHHDRLFHFTRKGTGVGGAIKCPYGTVGDRLFITVRQPDLSGTPEDRLWRNVYKFPNDCWEWFGDTRKKGYGRIRVNGIQMSVHRFSYLIHKGDPGESDVLHTCDVNWCINPAHLYLGDDLQNASDRKLRGGYIGPRGERSGHAKLSRENVDEIGRLSAEGLLQREIAARLGVNQSQISRVLGGKRWVADEEARIKGHRWLELTDVRVERVQQISDWDIVREGITGDGARPGIDIDIDGGLDHVFLISEWRELWIKINGQDSWERNEWLWCLTFKKVNR